MVEQTRATAIGGKTGASQVPIWIFHDLYQDYKLQVIGAMIIVETMVMSQICDTGTLAVLVVPMTNMDSVSQPVLLVVFSQVIDDFYR